MQHTRALRDAWRAHDRRLFELVDRGVPQEDGAHSAKIVSYQRRGKTIRRLKMW